MRFITAAALATVFALTAVSHGQLVANDEYRLELFYITEDVNASAIPVDDTFVLGESTDVVTADFGTFTVSSGQSSNGDGTTSAFVQVFNPDGMPPIGTQIDGFVVDTIFLSLASFPLQNGLDLVPGATLVSSSADALAGGVSFGPFTPGDGFLNAATGPDFFAEFALVNGDTAGNPADIAPLGIDTLRLDLVVTEIPEPSGLIGLAVAGFLLPRRR
ncbi:MAG: hypothetical protein AAGD32_06320 [Planctomycetota bacterium]